jgi:LAO/AO transport system kinase
VSTVRSSDPVALFSSARDGDRSALARLLSMIERGGPDARAVSALSHPLSGSAVTVGITGAPGAGKSTLTSALVGCIRAANEPVAVLAIDPSSPFTGGAILGDRVRMSEHSLDTDVFIRSMATRGHLGGLSVAVPEASRLLDAVGMPWVLIETVGVGQVEVEIAGEADTTVVVVNPGWGDAVQANKAGLMEIADIFVVNKSDRPGVQDTIGDIERMLSLRTRDGWRPPIITTVATTGDGVDGLWQAMRDHGEWSVESGQRVSRRAKRLETELRRMLEVRLLERVTDLASGDRWMTALSAAASGQSDPWDVIDDLLS